VPPVRFEIPACPEADADRLRRELGVSAPLAQILVRRRLGDPPAARSFLAADATHPPQAFAGIGDAAALILRHVAARNLITVHGDYDVDGICSTAILVRALRALGAEVDSYLPDRAGDGYGVSAATVRRLAARGTRLLVTVDCGITAVEEVDAARALGLDVVVSDHHAPRPDGVLPNAPIVHPAVCGYPCPHLCAAAVAHKLGQALLAAAQAEGTDPGHLRELRARLLDDFDLLALATIADVVPLLDENRRLVRRGLSALARTGKPGLRALMAIAGLEPQRVDERAVAFALAPRLNAAGRLYRADAGLELILTADADRATEIARELHGANAERRKVELGIRLEAEAQMDALGERPGYVLAGEGWHPGVIGIVASRLVERSGRPVVLVALEGDRGRGSGRSIVGFDLLGALTACSAHLTRYGGHAAAAGLEVERARVADLAAAFALHSGEALRRHDPVTRERVDAIVGGEELGMELAEELRLLAPHGAGNPTPAIMVADATLTDSRTMGEGRHVRFTVRSHGVRARAVAFGSGRLPVAEGVPVRATFTLQVNEWQGVSEPRLVLRHAEELAPGPGPPSVDAAPQAPAAEPDPAAVGVEPAAAELTLFAVP
jgi:single-stranded-DNA-specific exonuclease